jgi:hypothetical protein
MCFMCKDMLGERGISNKSKVFIRQAHMLMSGKVPWFAAWRHEAPIMWRPSKDFPKLA